MKCLICLIYGQIKILSNKHSAVKYTSVQKIGVGNIFVYLFIKTALFHQKRSKNSYIVKYYYNLE